MWFHVNHMITSHIAITFVEVCDYKKCAIMEIISFLSYRGKLLFLI